MKLVRYGDMSQEVFRLITRRFAARERRILLSWPGGMPAPELVLKHPKVADSQQTAERNGGRMIRGIMPARP